MDDQSQTPPPDAAPDLVELVAVVPGDRPCLVCGYNIRDLPINSVCPECGTPLARSLRGNLLRYSAPDYLATLHRGALLAELALAIYPLGALAVGAALIFGAVRGRPSTLQTAGASIWAFIQAGASLLSLLGWWQLTAPDPAFVGKDTGMHARSLLRVAILVAAAALCVQLPFTLGGESPAAFFPNLGGPAPSVAGIAMLVTMLLTMAAGIAGIVQFFASMQYVRALARRIPDPDLGARAKRFMWLGPVLAIVGACVLYIGPIVAFIMYVRLLDRLRVHLKHIRILAAADAPHPPTMPAV
jgi:hypothetical protein